MLAASILKRYCIMTQNRVSIFIFHLIITAAVLLRRVQRLVHSQKKLLSMYQRTWYRWCSWWKKSLRTACCRGWRLTLSRTLKPKYVGRCHKKKKKTYPRPPHNSTRLISVVNQSMHSVVEEIHRLIPWGTPKWFFIETCHIHIHCNQCLDCSLHS